MKCSSPRNCGESRVASALCAGAALVDSSGGASPERQLLVEGAADACPTQQQKGHHRMHKKIRWALININYVRTSESRESSVAVCAPIYYQGRITLQMRADGPEGEIAVVRGKRNKTTTSQSRVRVQCCMFGCVCHVRVCLFAHVWGSCSRAPSLQQ